MKQFIYLSVLSMSLVLGTVSCSTKSNKSNVETTEQTAQVEYLSVDDLLKNAASLQNKEIKVEGVCTHICSHGARKIFLMGSDDKQIIRIEAGELDPFSQKCVNNIVQVKGRLVEDRIDEDYLQRWEAQAKANDLEKHGDGEGGCSTEKSARQETGNTVYERIADFREKIAARAAKEGKSYLSFYHVVALSYEIPE